MPRRHWRILILGFAFCMTSEVCEDHDPQDGDVLALRVRTRAVGPEMELLPSPSWHMEPNYETRSGMMSILDEHSAMKATINE
jgi:hypothetical protein